MKKILSLVLALCMAMMAVSALAELTTVAETASDLPAELTGYWTIESCYDPESKQSLDAATLALFEMNYILILNEDGTAVFMAGEDVTEATWTYDKEAATVTVTAKDTDDTMVYAVSEGKLEFADDAGNIYTFVQAESVDGGSVSTSSNASEGEQALDSLKGLLSGLVTGITSSAQGTEDGSEETNTGEQALDSLKGLLSGLVSGGEGSEDGAEETNTGEQPLDSLKGLLSGLVSGSGEGAEGPKYVAAENIEQFYGTWKFSSATMFGQTVTLEQLGDKVKDLTLEFRISEEGLTGFGSSDKADVTVLEKTQLKLVDGALSFTDDGTAVAMHLTEEDELYFDLSFMGFYFTREAEAK